MSHDVHFARKFEETMDLPYVGIPANIASDFVTNAVVSKMKVQITQAGKFAAQQVLLPEARASILNAISKYSGQRVANWLGTAIVLQSTQQATAAAIRAVATVASTACSLFAVTQFAFSIASVIYDAIDPRHFKQALTTKYQIGKVLDEAIRRDKLDLYDMGFLKHVYPTEIYPIDYLPLPRSIFHTTEFVEYTKQFLDALDVNSRGEKIDKTLQTDINKKSNFLKFCDENKDGQIPQDISLILESIAVDSILREYEQTSAERVRQSTTRWLLHVGVPAVGAIAGTQTVKTLLKYSARAHPYSYS